jgi:hypothetical protein
MTPGSRDSQKDESKMSAGDRRIARKYSLRKHYERTDSFLSTGHLLAPRGHGAPTPEVPSVRMEMTLFGGFGQKSKEKYGPVSQY